MHQDESQRKMGDGGVTGSLSQGKKYWKSLEELGDSPEYREFVEREFPENASELLDPVSRRSFLGIMASSMALAGMTGCKAIRRPEQKLLAYNQQPEDVVPGNSLYYTTSMTLGSEVFGLMAESHTGRPTKLEGNPQHTNNQGAANRFNQAALLQLYDPDRSQSPRYMGKTSNWEKFKGALSSILSQYQANEGAGLAFCSRYISSPSTQKIRENLLARFPKAQWFTHETVPYSNNLLGLEKVTGQKLVEQNQFAQALRIFSVDCDFLGKEVSSLKNTRAFVKNRNHKTGEFSRMYLVESDYTITGAKADHRLPLKPSQVAAAMWALASELYIRRGLLLPPNIPISIKDTFQAGAKAFPASHQKFIEEAAADLLEFQGKSLVCVGKYQKPVIHALAYLINYTLGAIGNTVFYTDLPTLAFNSTNLEPFSDLKNLSSSLESGSVESVFFLDCNPIYGAPADIKFQENFKKAKHTVHYGLYQDETAALSQWHIPASHFLETWTDGIALDGLVTFGQPIIEPLYQTLSLDEYMVLLAGLPQQKSLEIIKTYWQTQSSSLDFEGSWRKWVHDGYMGSNFQGGKETQPQTSFASDVASIQFTQSGQYELIFREDASVYDGRFANNSWLQEFPDPLSRLTWDNMAFMGVHTAKQLGVDKKYFLENNAGVPLGKNEVPMVRIEVSGNMLEIPAYILPGVATGTIVLNIGYGRTNAGRVGDNVGFDVSVIQQSTSPFENSATQVSSVAKTYFVASVQEHWSMEGRDLARIEDIHHPHEKHHAHGASPSLHSEWDYSKGQQWAMSIDLNKCTGCGNCVIACQAENNIPVVGKKQVALNREMSWIRLDRYYAGEDLENPEVVHQPVACQHCETAPCEIVCPVAATVHSSEGLNDMVYNRCIGTRYCSNNCPYKVRRFNFFNYTNEYSEVEKMGQNPDVTVRFRGVMEKCSYCVQRINEKRNEYKVKGIELIPDGQIVPACQQTCPAEAITFGNQNDPNSKIAQAQKDPRNYHLLAETNARPRTSYLTKLTNKNAKLVAHTSSIHTEHRKDS